MRDKDMVGSKRRDKQAIAFHPGLQDKSGSFILMHARRFDHSLEFVL